jgi:Flp pilus assembly pilin Flp
MTTSTTIPQDSRQTEDFRFGRIAFDAIRRNAIWCLSVLVTYAVVRSLVYAANKPFWFDEVLTWVVCRQGSLSAIWKALKRGVDGNPPGFYLIERGAAWLIPDQHLGYRVLSAIGFAGTLVFLYLFVNKRNGTVSALIAASLLLITPLFTLYAAEARPYGLLTAFIALALVCYQHAPSKPWLAGLSLSLLAAGSLHHYAAVTFLPFFLAELAATYQARKIRFGVWLALVTSLAPLSISWPMLMWMKQNWGAHFWARAALNDVPATYGSFFRVQSAWGTALAGVAILAMLASFVRWGQQAEGAEEPPATPAAERVLILGLIALPMVGYVVARITHGPFVERYFLSAILGMISAAGYALGRTKVRGILVATMFLVFAIGSQELGFWSSLGHRQTRADIVEPIASLADPRYPDLPIVISDAGEYVEFWHYAPPELLRRVVTLPDPLNAAEYAGIDTVDKLVIALSSCEPVAIQEFSHFAAEHPVFLLYSDGSKFDWWPARLTHDGDRMQLLGVRGGGAVYLVELKPHDRTTHGTD